MHLLQHSMAVPSLLDSLRRCDVIDMGHGGRAGANGDRATADRPGYIFIPADLVAGDNITTNRRWHNGWIWILLVLTVSWVSHTHYSAMSRAARVASM